MSFSEKEHYLNYLELFQYLDTCFLAQFQIKRKNLCKMIQQAVNERNLRAVYGAFRIFEEKCRIGEFKWDSEFNFAMYFHIISDGDKKNYYITGQILKIIMKAHLVNESKNNLAKIREQIQLASFAFEKSIRTADNSQTENIKKGYVSFIKYWFYVVLKLPSSYYHQEIPSFLSKNKKEYTYIKTLYDMIYCINQILDDEEETVDFLERKIHGLYIVTSGLDFYLQMITYVLQKMFEFKHLMKKQRYQQNLLKIESVLTTIHSNRINLTDGWHIFIDKLKHKAYFNSMKAVFDLNNEGQYSIIQSFMIKLDNVIETFAKKNQDKECHLIEEALFYLQLRDRRNQLGGWQQLTNFPLINTSTVQNAIRNQNLKKIFKVQTSQKYHTAKQIYFLFSEKQNTNEIFNSLNILEKTICIFYLFNPGIETRTSSLLWKLDNRQFLGLVKFCLIDLQLGNYAQRNSILQIKDQKCRNSTLTNMYETFTTMLFNRLLRSLKKILDQDSSQVLTSIFHLNRFYLVLSQAMFKPESENYLCKFCYSRSTQLHCVYCEKVCMRVVLKLRQKVCLQRFHHFNDELRKEAGQVKKKLEKVLWKKVSEDSLMKVRVISKLIRI